MMKSPLLLAYHPSKDDFFF